MRHLLRASFVGALALVAATSVTASVSAYSSASSFSAAVTGEVAYDFTGIAAANDFAVGAVTVGGVTFDSSGIAFVIDTAYNPTYGTPFLSGQSSTTAPSDVLVSTAGTFAISFNFGSYVATSGTPVTIQLSTGDTFTEAMPTSPQTTFIGFVLTTPITSLQFTTIDNSDTTGTTFAYAMDIVKFSVASAIAPAVPEPETYALMVAGLLAIGGMARRRNRQG